MLATLYVGYVIVLAKLKPALMPPLRGERAPGAAAADRAGAVGAAAATPSAACCARSAAGPPRVPARTVLAQLFVTLLPALFDRALLAVTYQRGDRAGGRGEHRGPDRGRRRGGGGGDRAGRNRPA